MRCLQDQRKGERMSELLDRTMARLTSIKVQRQNGEVFFSYVPTREVFLAGQKNGLTQEQFQEKRQNSQQTVGDIFRRIHAQKAKGYRKIQREAFRELEEIMSAGYFDTDKEQAG